MDTAISAAVNPAAGGASGLRARPEPRNRRDGASSARIPHNDPDAAARIARWAEDIAGHPAAADAIGTMGDAAIPPLAAYLHVGPQVIPQPRCFAVAMLARLDCSAATAALRAVAHDHPLHGLSALLAESESVVKNAAMAALAGRRCAPGPADVAFGIGERLRAAVALGGRLRLTGSAGALVALLDDDTLADSAAESLAMLGDSAADAIIATLDAWALEAACSARRRIALLRALQVLHALHAAPPAATLEHLLHAQHPAVQAAAALLVWPRRHDAEIVRELIHGAVAFDWRLEDRCRAALQDSACAARAAAADALRRDAEPDLYGSMQPLTTGQTDWLRRFIAAGAAP